MGAQTRRYWIVDGLADVRARASSNFAFSSRSDRRGGSLLLRGQWEFIRRMDVYIYAVSFFGTSALVWWIGLLCTEYIRVDGDRVGRVLPPPLLWPLLLHRRLFSAVGSELVRSALPFLSL